MCKMAVNDWKNYDKIVNDYYEKILLWFEYVYEGHDHIRISKTTVLSFSEKN